MIPWPPKVGQFDTETGRLRHAAHMAFDALWEGRDKRFRRLCYRYMARKMGLTGEECHVSRMGKDRLREFFHIALNTTPEDIEEWKRSGQQWRG